MKTILRTGALALVLFMASCGGGTAETKNGIEYTSEYVCPMHCEGSGSASEGTCPVCGMDYVKNESKSE